MQAQHPFLWKTWGWFICRSLRKSYTTHYAFKPRIIVPKHPSRALVGFSFVLIKGNRILLLTEFSGNDTVLHLSIHEIRSDHCVGPALWSSSSSIHRYFDIDDLVLIKSTKNALGITIGMPFHDYLKLFDISTTDTDASNNFPLIECGRIEFDLKLEAWSRYFSKNFGLSEIFMPCWTCSNNFSQSDYPPTGTFS